MDENLPVRIKYWLSEAKHDCIFVVGPENGPTEKIGAIKHILMGDSEPFRAMLQDSELAEKGDVRVTDVEPETFKTFLICVYGASNLVVPKLLFEECAKLLYVTEKYMVNDIKPTITQHLKSLFTPDKIIVALSHPICYQEESFKLDILNHIKFHFNELTMDDKFLDLSDAAITWILQQECFYVREIEIWNATLRWAKHKTGSSDGKVLRSYIFDLLKYFRFLTMDCSEFWDNVVSSEILLEEEVNDICRAFVSGKPCSFKHLCPNRSNRYNIELVSKNVVTSFTESPKYAFIRCSISSISDLECYNQYSKTYHWAGHLWHLTMRRVKRDGKETTLGVFVGCRGLMSNWNCVSDVEISLVNHNGIPDESRNFTKAFSPSALDWGFSDFYDWIVLLNPKNGYVKDNSIVLMVRIQLKNT